MGENNSDTPINGPATAGVVAAGVGCLVLGALTIAAEASESVHSLLEIASASGTLGGKALGTIVAWTASWAALHVRWRARELHSRRPVVVAATLIALGLLGTFPPFFCLFG